MAGVPISVVVDPTEPSRWSVLHREVGGRVVQLMAVGGVVIDAETGTSWDAGNGRALEGPLAGEVLGSLPGFTSFLGDAETFWPDARYWNP